MAMAGYNIDRAVEFWSKMSDSSKSAPPAFMSTHPSDQNRIDAIKKALPEVSKYKKK